MNELIAIKNLQIGSGNDILVHHLSLTLKRGEPLTILGETGSGKSLLAHAIMGTLSSDLNCTGTIALNGEVKSTPERRQYWGHSLTMLPQEPWQSLDPIMKSREQVAEVYKEVQGHSAPQASRAAQAQLSRLGLTDVEHKLPLQLSGGMAQRLAFAAATAAGAGIIIADEPTKGLDNHQRNSIVSILKAQTQDGGLLTITHDVEVAKQLGGKIIVMRHGQVLEQGEASHVLSAPSSDYAKALIAAAPCHWSPMPTGNVKQPLVEVKALAQQRNGVTLFKNLSFTLHCGEVIGLFGDSGCGKSTLGDTLLGLLQPSAGSINWQQQIKRHQKLKLYQDPPSSFSAATSLATLLHDVVRLHKLDPAEISALLSPLNLTDELLCRCSHDVSGGELQRIALLRAMLLSPKLLVADEPTSRLDPITAQQIITLLVDNARQQQCGLILISHDEALLKKVCNKVIYLQDYAS
ncbi:ABC transporter ATP-binding protein [Shewanella youngdeokensis]|uniref:ATP-binding cassette domain-containing protein n=1 Tax=Shewanella youngdeokensis TaxID=2999068 RepID=A0ABZ0K1Q2_9GAMM|nr:ATP-binding cassette domain-containing protein [Shewanella sp. DAU334]